MISNSDFEKLWFLYKAKESWSRTFFRLASSKKRLEVERTITITMGRFAQNRKKIYKKSFNSVRVRVNVNVTRKDERSRSGSVV